MEKKILIIDDEQEMVDLIAKRLESAGYDTIFSTNAKEGIAKAQAKSPDLILMDIMMPGMTGGDAVRILRADSKTKDIPVIFISAMINKQEGKDSEKINVGGVLYTTIAKPFESKELLDKISEKLEK